MFSMENNKSTSHRVLDEPASTLGTVPALEGTSATNTQPVVIICWRMATTLAYISHRDDEFGVLGAVHHAAELQSSGYHMESVFAKLFSGLHGGSQNVPDAVEDMLNLEIAGNVTIQWVSSQAI